MFSPFGIRWAGLGLTLLAIPLPAAAPTNDHVILITIDGLAAYYLTDPQAPLATLRRVAAEGAVAQSLEVCNPTTTWPNHTTLVTGVTPQNHELLFNGMLVREGPGQPVRIEVERNQSELVSSPTVYDVAHRAGFRTAAINWPATRGSTTLDDNFPDAPDRVSQTTPRLRAELVRARILEDVSDAAFVRKSAAAHDQAWTAAALHLLRVRPPNLLLLHLLSTDVIQHRYGPQSPAAYSALGLTDGLVGQILAAIQTGALRDHTTVLIASDHGFARPSKLINPNVVLRKAGLLRPAPRRRAQSVSEGGTAFVYLTQPATAAEDRTQVIALLRGVEGIDQILEPRQFAALHLPNPAGNPQMGNLLLLAKPGYAFSDEFLDDEAITPLPLDLGSHGYLASDPQMSGIFIAWGNKIKSGTKLGQVAAVDVAPTIAALLGTTLANTEGHLLGQMFAEGERHPTNP